MHGGWPNTSQSGFQVSAPATCVGKSHDANHFPRSALCCTARRRGPSRNIAFNETVRGFRLRLRVRPYRRARYETLKKSARAVGVYRLLFTLSRIEP
jgi:hypothetical protein